MMEIALKYFTLNDIFVFGALSIMGAIGAFVKFIVVNYDFDKKAHEIPKPQFESLDAGGAQVFTRIIIGAIAAMLLGLAMADAFIPERGPFFKLLLLGFAAGYLAPEFFKSQEKRMLKHLTTQKMTLPKQEKEAKAKDKSDENA